MARPKQVTDETWNNISDDYKSGMSIRILSEKYNISKTHIDNKLRQLGLLMRTVGQPKSDNPYESLEVFVSKLKERFNRGDINEEEMSNEYNKFISEYERRQDKDYYKNNIPSGLHGESVHKDGKGSHEVANEDRRPQPVSDKGEIYDDIMNQIREQFESNAISKTEAQLKWMFFRDEFDELGRFDFDRKYRNKVFNAKK